MTTGLYAGISAADLGYEPDLPVATCPKCGGLIYRRQCPPRGLICSGCLDVYNDIAEVTAAQEEALMWEYYYESEDDQRDEDEDGHGDTVAAGLERWAR
jgi:hypothetical protein